MTTRREVDRGVNRMEGEERWAESPTIHASVSPGRFILALHLLSFSCRVPCPSSLHTSLHPAGGEGGETDRSEGREKGG